MEDNIQSAENEIIEETNSSPIAAGEVAMPDGEVTDTVQGDDDKNAASAESEVVEVVENSLDHWATENVDDTEEAADEIGVSGDYDAYGREIIRDVFENRLRLAPNSVKLSYSRLKNELLSYKGVRRRYVGQEERFYAPSEEGYGDVIVKFGIEGNTLIVEIDGESIELKKLESYIESADTAAADGESVSLDDEVGTSATDQRSISPDAEAADITASEASDITREADSTVAKGDATEALKSAVAAIEKLATARGFEKKADYIRTAYAERYPFNPDAVIRGRHEEAPIEGEFDGPEYEPIEGELMRDLLGELIAEIAEKEGKEKLDELRQEAQTMKDATALTEPIVHFYNVARDSENNIGYVTLQQVLNDKFLGKLLPPQFFAVAEGSKRIETLNLLAVKEAAKAADLRPDLVIVTVASARLLIRDDVLDRLIKAANTENHNLVLAFDCALLEALGERGLTGIRKLAENDVKIMIDNTENAGLKVLTEYNIDYLRFDARYYKEEDPRKTAHLDMVLGYAKVQGIKTSAIYVDSVKEARFMLAHGVMNIEGDVVGQPLRIIANAIKQAKRLPIK